MMQIEYVDKWLFARCYDATLHELTGEYVRAASCWGMALQLLLTAMTHCKEIDMDTFRRVFALINDRYYATTDKAERGK